MVSKGGEGVRLQAKAGQGWHVFYIAIQVLNSRTGCIKLFQTNDFLTLFFERS